ncbi:hypothetical protein NL676_030969 [Syzygium grande]|nr:hypothetical protein NL676_030969 [Syzygium grande]
MLLQLSHNVVTPLCLPLLVPICSTLEMCLSVYMTRAFPCRQGPGTENLPDFFGLYTWKYNLVRLQELFNEEGCEAKLLLNGDGKPYVTDNSNYIVDLYFKTPIKDGRAAGKEISLLEGVVEHELFLDMATASNIAGNTSLDVKTK